MQSFSVNGQFEVLRGYPNYEKLLLHCNKFEKLSKNSFESYSELYSMYYKLLQVLILIFYNEITIRNPLKF